jgi:hypothetical protein
MTHAKATFVSLLIGLAGILAAYLAPAAAHAEAILTGVNFVHPSSFSIADQNAALPR